jgi:hypothetical protein
MCFYGKELIKLHANGDPPSLKFPILIRFVVNFDVFVSQLSASFSFGV